MVRLRGFGTVLALLSAAILQGCGGGSGDEPDPSDLGSDFSVSPNSLTFTARVDQEAPAAQTVVVTAQDSQTETPDIRYNTEVLDSAIESFPNNRTMEIEVSVQAPYFLTVGVHTTTVVVENSQKSITIPVTYTISDLPPSDPDVAYLSPYISQQGESSEVALRGGGFDQLVDVPVIRVGETTATNVEVVTDSHIRMTIPGLDAGVYPVTLESDIEFPGSADLHVVPERQFAAVNLSSMGQKNRVLFDEQRSAIYVVNATTGVLERYRFESGTSWQMDQLFVAGISDAALSPDGKTLVVVDGKRFYEVELGTAQMTLGSVGEVELGTYDSVDRIATGSNGMMYGVSDGQWTPVFTYDIATGETKSLQYRNSQGTLVDYLLYRPTPFPTPDGTQLYLGERGHTRSVLYRVDTSENAPVETGLETSSQGYRSMAFSRDGKLTILNGQNLYNENLEPLGSLPTPHTTAVFSPDGASVYTYTRSNGSEYNLLSKYDVSDPAVPQQVGATVSLADGPLIPDAMDISVDGNTLFLGGAEQVLVVDLTTLTF